MAHKITVLLVDDHALVRRGFRRMLEDDAEISVVGEASTGKEAVRLALELRPKVIVMDCAMPELSGIEATRKILEKFPEAEILMLSMHSEETLVGQALDAGARGYVLKNAMDLDLVNAVKSVAGGMTVLDPQVSRPENLRGERVGGLTPRELEILQHIVAGKSNKEIAAELNLSANTVAVHPVGRLRDRSCSCVNSSAFAKTIDPRTHVSLFGRDCRGGHSVPAQQWRLRWQAPPRDPGLWLCIPRLRWRWLARHSSRQRIGLARTQTPAILSPALPEQSQRHVYRCDAKRGPGYRDVRHGCGCRRLQQRRIS